MTNKTKVSDNRKSLYKALKALIVYLKYQKLLYLLCILFKNNTKLLMDYECFVFDQLNDLLDTGSFKPKHYVI